MNQFKIVFYRLSYCIVKAKCGGSTWILHAHSAHNFFQIEMKPRKEWPRRDFLRPTSVKITILTVVLIINWTP